MHTDDLALFSSLPIFRDFSNIELMLVLMGAAAENYETGAPIVKEGKPGNALYIVKSGEVRIAKFDGKGIERDIASLGKGDCFGEISLIDAEPHSASVYAGSKCLVYRVGKDEFTDLCFNHKEIERKFFRNISRILAERLRRSNESLTFSMEIGDMIKEINKDGRLN